MTRWIENSGLHTANNHENSSGASVDVLVMLRMRLHAPNAVATVRSCLACCINNSGVSVQTPHTSGTRGNQPLRPSLPQAELPGT